MKDFCCSRCGCEDVDKLVSFFICKSCSAQQAKQTIERHRRLYKE